MVIEGRNASASVLTPPSWKKGLALLLWGVPLLAGAVGRGDMSFEGRNALAHGLTPPSSKRGLADSGSRGT